MEEMVCPSGSSASCCSRVRARLMPARSRGGRSGGRAGTSRRPPTSLALPVSFAGVSRGVISFDLQRTGDTPAREWETVFSLLDRSGVQVLRLQVSWTPAAGRGNPTLTFRGPGKGDEYRPPRDRPLGTGRRAGPAGGPRRVDPRGPDLGRCGPEVRRRRRRQGADQEVPGTASAGKSLSPEEREQINSELERLGQPKAFDSRPLGAFISGVVSVQLGSYGPPVLGQQGRRAPSPPGSGVPISAAPSSKTSPSPWTRSPRPAPGHLVGEPRCGPGLGLLRQARGRRHSSRDPGREARGDGNLRPGALPGPRRQGHARLARLGGLPRGEGLLRGEARSISATSRVTGSTRARRRSTRPRRAWSRSRSWKSACRATPSSCCRSTRPTTWPRWRACATGRRGRSLRRSRGSRSTETAPGVYAGSWRAGWQDRYPRAVVVGRLEQGGAEATLAGTTVLAIDPGLTIAVAAEPNELKADEVSTSTDHRDGDRRQRQRRLRPQGEIPPGHDLAVHRAWSAAGTSPTRSAAGSRRTAGSRPTCSAGWR